MDASNQARGGRIWIATYSGQAVVADADEVRWHGKGNPAYYVAEIQAGKVLYEMDGL